ncbi:MAG: hypothetical protein ABI593_11885 [Betaproteobacteria bacterium]
MNQFKLTTVAAAFGLALSTGAIAAAMSQADYNATKANIAATLKSDRSSCATMSGNARDVCTVESKGRAGVAQAELEANYSPTDKHWYTARVAKADAAYAVAKERCDDFAGNAKDVCRKEATAAHVRAKADAKVAVTTSEANAEAREKKVDAQKDASADKRNADYAVAKEKCDALAGDVKDACIKDAKLRFGQT